MRRALVILGTLVGFAIVVIAMAPATLAGAAVARESRGMLSLADAQGGFWHGRGTLAAGPSFRLPLAWSIDPWPLLRGELHLRIIPATASAGTPHADIVAHRDAAALRDVDVVLPANTVDGLLPRSGIHVDGEARVVAPTLEWTPAAFAGGARIDWQDAQFALAGESPIRLGTVTATLSAAGDRLAGPLSNEGGTSEVHGDLALTTNGAPNVSVTIAPRGGDPARTRKLVVSSDPSGHWNVDYRVGIP